MNTTVCSKPITSSTKKDFEDATSEDSVPTTGARVSATYDYQIDDVVGDPYHWTAKANTGYNFGGADQVSGGGIQGVNVPLALPPAPQEDICTVVFDANGGANTVWETVPSGTTASLPGVKYYTGADLPACGFKREHYDFMGWALTPDGPVKYGDKAHVDKLTDINNNTVTFYAVWRPYTHISLDIRCDHDVTDNYEIPARQQKQHFDAGDNGWYNLSGAQYTVADKNGANDTNGVMTTGHTDTKQPGETQVTTADIWVHSDADYSVRLTRSPRKANDKGGIGDDYDENVPSGYRDGEKIGTGGVDVHAGGAFPYNEKSDFDKYISDVLLPDVGTLSVLRKSSTPDKTVGNDNYDLSGAPYHLNQMWDDEVGGPFYSIVTNVSGDRMVTDKSACYTPDFQFLEFGTYDVQEVSNSRGYEYDLDMSNASRHANVTLTPVGSGFGLSKDGEHTDVVAQPDTYVKPHVHDVAGESSGQAVTAIFSPDPYLVTVQADVLSDDPDYTADYNGRQNANYDLAEARYSLKASMPSPWFKGSTQKAKSTTTDAVTEESREDADNVHDSRLGNSSVLADSHPTTSQTSGETSTRQRKGVVQWDGLPLGTYVLDQVMPAKGFKPDDKVYTLTFTSKPSEAKDAQTNWTLVTSERSEGENGANHGERPTPDYVAPSVRGPYYTEADRPTPTGRVKLSDMVPDNRHVFALRSFNVPKTGTLTINTGIKGDGDSANEANNAVSADAEDIANQTWFGIYYDDKCTDLFGVVNRDGEFKTMRTGRYGNDELTYDTVTQIPFPQDRFYLRMLTAPLHYDLDRRIYSFDVDEDNPNQTLTLPSEDIVRASGYLKASRTSANRETTVTNANYDLTGALYGVYSRHDAAKKAADTVMGNRKKAENDAIGTQGRTISPTRGYAIMSDGKVTQERMGLEATRISDVSDGLVDVLASMTVDADGTVVTKTAPGQKDGDPIDVRSSVVTEPGTMAVSHGTDKDGKAPFAEYAFLRRGVASKDGNVDRNAVGDYMLPVGDYYVTEIAASKGYDNASDDSLPVLAVRVLTHIDPIALKDGAETTICEIGGWRYSLPGFQGTKGHKALPIDRQVFAGVALETGEDGKLYEVPVVIGHTPESVRVTRSRNAEDNADSTIAAGVTTETYGAFELDGKPFVIENHDNAGLNVQESDYEAAKSGDDWYVSSVPGVRADEFLADTAATGITLIESDNPGTGKEGIDHVESARRVIASASVTGYGRQIDDAAKRGDAYQSRRNFVCGLRPFPVYVQYVMSSKSAVSQSDVVIGALGQGLIENDGTYFKKNPETGDFDSVPEDESESIFNAKYQDNRLNEQVMAGDGNAFRSDSNETGSPVVRVMPLEWPIRHAVKGAQDTGSEEIWKDRPYQVPVSNTDKSQDSYDAVLTRDYPRAWLWRSNRYVLNHADAKASPDSGQFTPVAYVPDWLALFDADETPLSDGNKSQYAKVDADDSKESTTQPLDLYDGIQHVKDLHPGTLPDGTKAGIYPDYRMVEGDPDYCPKRNGQDPTKDDVIDVYEHYRQIGKEGTQSK